MKRRNFLTLVPKSFLGLSIIPSIDFSNELPVKLSKNQRFKKLLHTFLVAIDAKNLDAVHAKMDQHYPAFFQGLSELGHHYCFGGIHVVKNDPIIIMYLAKKREFFTIVRSHIEALKTVQEIDDYVKTQCEIFTIADEVYIEFKNSPDVEIERRKWVIEKFRKTFFEIEKRRLNEQIAYVYA